MILLLSQVGSAVPKDPGLVRGGGSTCEQLISGVDLSDLSPIESKGVRFYNPDGEEEDLLSILKKAGVNMARLRVWVDPEDSHSSLREVKEACEELRALGFDLWIALHYSDTWADPGHQILPRRWRGMSYDLLKDSLYSYTQMVVRETKPSIIQIGNETNAGFLFPYGRIIDTNEGFKGLISTAIRAVREISPDTRIAIHYAGYRGAEEFFAGLAGMDYDIIAVSYYPWAHGKDLEELRSTLRNLSEIFGKDIVIAETAYPFTLDWNDWTHNIVGVKQHLILPDYPATPEGQLAFLQRIKEIITETPRGIGFCYWGGALVAFDGPESSQGSHWENLALFDFGNRALPVLKVFDSGKP